MTALQGFIDYAAKAIPSLAETFNELNINDVAALEAELRDEAAAFDDFERGDHMGGGAQFYPDLPLTDLGVSDQYAAYKAAQPRPSI